MNWVDRGTVRSLSRSVSSQLKDPGPGTRGGTGLKGQERDDMSRYRGSDISRSLTVSNMFCTCRDMADAIDDGIRRQGCLLNCFGLQTPCLDLSAERPLMGVLSESQPVPGRCRFVSVM